MNIQLKSIESIKIITPESLLKEIAADMEKQVQLRFRKTRDPNDKLWDKLKDSTISRRRKGSSKPLNDTGKLKGSISSKFTSKYAVVGTNYEIATTHQFGAKQGQYKKIPTGNGKTRNIPWGNIPQRAFLGFSKKQAKSYLKKIIDYNKGKRIVITFK